MIYGWSIACILYIHQFDLSRMNTIYYIRTIRLHRIRSDFERSRVTFAWLNREKNHRLFFFILKAQKKWMSFTFQQLCLWFFLTILSEDIWKQCFENMLPLTSRTYHTTYANNKFCNSWGCTLIYVRHVSKSFNIYCVHLPHIFFVIAMTINA